MKCISYTDYSLRNFFNQIKNQAWFNNTLFVITADHTGYPNSEYNTHGAGNFEIPILFFDPGAALKGKNNIVTQQIDILPGVMDYLGYPNDYFAFGNNPFDTLRTGWNINYNSGTYCYITENDLLYFDGNKTIGYYKWRNDSTLQINRKDSAKSETIPSETAMKIFLQVYSASLRKNKMTLSH